MNAVSPAGPAASQQAAVEAALVLLERMGLSPADLVAAPRDRVVPTFAEYVPVVSAAVSDGTRRAYGSYWNRIVEHWGAGRLDEIAPSDIRQLMTWVKIHVVARRNAREAGAAIGGGGRYRPGPVPARLDAKVEGRLHQHFPRPVVGAAAGERAVPGSGLPGLARAVAGAART